jgi:hypothetical protein
MPSGEVRVRRADPVLDRDKIVSVLRRNMRTVRNVEARHDWLYLHNPGGKAWVWLAEDSASGEAVGTSSGYPKRVRVDGKVLDVLDLSDFTVDPTHRTLGPALKLLRATLEPMKGQFAFSYDHPSANMLAVYKRMGGRDVSQRQRWVRLLKVSPQIEKRVKGMGSLLGGVAGKLGDLALGAKDSLSRPRSRFKIALLDGAPGPEFDRLDEETAHQARARVVRSAAHVAWRFLQHTDVKHEILCARDGQRLVGYLVFRPREEQVLAIVDVVTRDEPEICEALIGGLISLGRQREASALWATVLDGGPAQDLFPRNGFTARSTGPGLVVYAPEAPAGARETISQARSWWMLEGDEDV